MDITITLPPRTTLGDLTAAAGAILRASADYADWEALANGDKDAVVRAPGLILLSIAQQLTRAEQ